MSLRRATADDASALTRLRAAMLESMGDVAAHGDGSVGAGSDEPWRLCADEMFARRLSEDPETFVAFVVEDADGTLVASGVGWISEHLPGPHNVTGRRGYIASMSTVPDGRRQGHGRQIVAALLDWFDERAISRVDLVATPMGEPLYRSFGFADHRGAVALVRRGEEQLPKSAGLDAGDLDSDAACC
ncbi:MAG TPA: GNAT family N-acetyltransferase [Mycobacteriales bacterium]|nr:GNAT family N-acetyltransferase [Mycobacteriales bacterium]